MTDHAPYTLTLPATRLSPVVFASPHSGQVYPAEMRAQAVLDETLLRSSEDAFVDELFAAAPSCGAPLLAARFGRAYLDLNRAADELDPAVIADVPRRGHNPRVASGLGVIPRVVAGGRPIYRGKLPRFVAERRLAQIWHPYHARLEALLAESHRSFGQAILVDCHSMPPEAVSSVSAACGRTPDVVIGDRFGASASQDVVEEIEAAFASAGLTVTRNTPFAGAYIAQHYGRPSRRQHVVQVEINRGLYLSPRGMARSDGFAALKAALDIAIPRIAALGGATPAVAAE